mgnify:CR=1 FL=1
MRRTAIHPGEHLAEQLEAKAHPLPELLQGLSRDRLKELCRALGLDDSGKEKAAIIARLAGTAARCECNTPPSVAAAYTTTATPAESSEVAKPTSASNFNSSRSTRLSPSVPDVALRGVRLTELLKRVLPRPWKPPLATSSF